MRQSIRTLLFCISSCLLTAQAVVAHGEKSGISEDSATAKTAHARIECPASAIIKLTKDQSGAMANFHCSDISGRILMVGNAQNFGDISVVNGSTYGSASVQVECPLGSSVSAGAAFRSMHREINFSCGFLEKGNEDHGQKMRILSVEVVPPLRCDSVLSRQNNAATVMTCSQ